MTFAVIFILGIGIIALIVACKATRETQKFIEELNRLEQLEREMYEREH